MRSPILVAGLLAGTSIAAPALAQDNQQAPIVITPPTSFSLPAATPTPSASPTATPSPAPVIAPPPVVRTQPAPTPSPAAGASPRPRATSGVRDTPGTTPTPTPTPVSAPAPSPAAPAPVAIAPPVPMPGATPSAPTEAPEDGASWWPWAAGALGLVLLAGAVLWWRRQRGGDDAGEVIVAPVEPAAAAPATRAEPVAAPAPARAAGPAVSPATPPPAPAPRESLMIELRPRALRTRGPDAILDFELVVINAGGAPLDAIRPAIGIASAGPEIAATIATFHAQSAAMPAPEPFRLESGQAQTVAGELTLTGDAMHVTEVGDRPMIVPVVIVALRWREGLSIKTRGDAYVVGTGDRGSARLGPIWVDRTGEQLVRLSARRFDPPR